MLCPSHYTHAADLTRLLLCTVNGLHLAKLSIALSVGFASLILCDVG